MRRILAIAGYPDPGVQRVLYLNVLVSSLGYGLYESVSSLYLLRVLHYSPQAVGAAVTASLIAGVVISPLVGRLCDIWNVRAVCIASSTGQFLSLACLALATHVMPAWLALVVLGVAEAAGGVARGAIVPHLVTGDDRVLLSARMRTGFNFGFCLATLGAGIAIAADSSTVYRALILANGAAALFVIWQYFVRIPKVAHRREVQTPGEPRRRSLKYVLFAVTSGVVNWIDYVLAVGVPLIVLATGVVTVSMVSVLIFVNTVLVVVLQVPIANRLSKIGRQRWLLGSSFGALGLGLGGFSLAYAAGSPWLSGVLLVALVILLTFVEVVVVALRWKLRYELAPEGAHGLYSGYFTFGDSIAKVGGPLILATFVATDGATGWLWIGGLIVLAGLGALWTSRTSAGTETNLEPVTA
jgi:MFS family permease